MSVVYLDTDVAVYLAGGSTDKLSTRAKRKIEASELLISPMAFFELDYLFRHKRSSVDAPGMLSALNATFGVSLCQLPFAGVVHQALGIAWTTDPFDRLIVAHAQANRQAPLITQDRLIRRHYSHAIW